MQIHRVKKDRDFTIINNAIFKGTLSLKARGLYCQIMSFPDDWDLSIKGLEALLPDGRRSISSAMQELVEAGLARFSKFHNGRHLEQFWEVFEEAQNVESQNVSSQKLKAQNVSSQNVTQYKNLINKELINKELTNKNKAVSDFSNKNVEEESQESEQAKPNQYPADFEDFWKAYPAKVAKKSAFEAFKKAKKQASAEMITNGARRYAEWLRKKQAQRADYPAKYPQGWLSDSRWEDVLEDVKAPVTAASVTANSNWEGVKSGVGNWADYIKKK
jgi:hypothetical protein